MLGAFFRRNTQHERDTPFSVDPMDDAQLAQRIAEGTPGTTSAEEAELYRRFAPRVRLYGRRLLASPAACDDLAQDVMLVTIQRLHARKIRELAQIGSFILGTARMMVQSERRVSRRRESLVERFLDPDEAVRPSLVALDAARMTNCLNQLAERDRIVVLLTYYADREASHIAAELGATSGAVRVIRHRAIEHLRDCVMGASHAD
jgi:RNA polymerase sigma-70 factor (ECF subfamily)